MTQLYDGYLKPAGLRITQFSLLRALETTGEATIGGLAERTLMDRTTLTRNLKVLERMGHVRIEEGADRRTKRIRPTAKGRRAVRRAYPLWEEAQARFESRYGTDEWQRLRGDLARVIDTMRVE